MSVAVAAAYETAAPAALVASIVRFGLTDVTTGGNFQYTGGDTTLIADANLFLSLGAGKSAVVTYLQEDTDSSPVGQGMVTATPGTIRLQICAG